MMDFVEFLFMQQVLDFVKCPPSRHIYEMIMSAFSTFYKYGLLH